jgi:hypothetical protein
MVTDRDLAAAVLIALILLVIALCAWPGFLRLRSRDLAGFWAAPGGVLYEVRATGDRTFDVVAPGADAPVRAPGHLAGVRGVRVASGGPALAGRVELGSRRVHWKNGTSWTRQGLGPYL